MAHSKWRLRGDCLQMSNVTEFNQCVIVSVGFKTGPHIHTGVRELGKETQIAEAPGATVARPLCCRHHPTCPVKAIPDAAAATQLGGDYGKLFFIHIYLYTHTHTHTYPYIRERLQLRALLGLLPWRPASSAYPLCMCSGPTPDFLGDGAAKVPRVLFSR